MHQGSSSMPNESTLSTSISEVDHHHHHHHHHDLNDNNNSYHDKYSDTHSDDRSIGDRSIGDRSIGDKSIGEFSENDDITDNISKSLFSMSIANTTLTSMDGIKRKNNNNNNNKLKNNNLIIPTKLFEIDYVGTGTYQISQHNILQKRSIEPYKNSEALLSSRGLHHRSKEVFVKEVHATTALISSITKRDTKKISNIKIKPSQQLFIPHFQRALAHERLKQIDKAIEDYSLCLRIDSNHAPSYFNRGGMYKVKGEYNKAVEDLNKAVDLDPSNINYRQQRALMFRLTGNYIEAVNETLFHRSLQKQQDRDNLMNSSSSTHYELKPISLRDFQKEISHMTRLMEDPILACLQKDKQKRTKIDLEPVVDFLKELKVFSDFSNRSAMYKIANNLELHHYRRGKFIFRQNDPGLHFFIVLDGEISIVKYKSHLIPSNNTVPNNNEKSEENEEENQDEEAGVISATHYDVIWKCYRGQSFGETALECEGGLRTAGAVATRQSTLMALHVDPFRLVLTAFKRAQTEEVKILLKNSMLFDGWEEEKIDYLGDIHFDRMLLDDLDNE